MVHLPPRQLWVAPRAQAGPSCAAGPLQTLCLLTLPTPVSDCPSFCLFILQALTLSLCVCLCVCLSVPYHSGCVCLSLPWQLSLPGFVLQHLFLCLSVFVSPSLYISLPSASLFTNACLCLSFSDPFPSPSSITILWLAAPGGLQQSNETAWGHLRALPGVHFPVTSTCPSPLRGLLSSLCSCGAWKGRPGREDTGPSICSGAPEPLTPSAAIKGAGSRGSER